MPLRCVFLSLVLGLLSISKAFFFSLMAGYVLAAKRMIHYLGKLGQCYHSTIDLNWSLRS